MVNLYRLLAYKGVVSTYREYARLIQQGGIKVNDEVIERMSYVVMEDDDRIQVGKHTFLMKDGNEWKRL